MDDFGTGYSSLSYLGRFPVDILKMDRSFLASRENDSLAAAIIALGENLTLEVVAEGIEHPEQAASLQDLGCNLGQGFLFARPMNDGALAEYLSEGRQDRVDAARRSQPEGRCSIATRRSTARGACRAPTSSRRSATGTSACSGWG